MDCRQVESCLRRDWPGDRDWEVKHKGSPLSEAELVQQTHDERQKAAWWFGEGEFPTGEQQYEVKMQALKFMQQVYLDVERNTTEGDGEGVEYMALYGNRRLVEPKLIYGRKKNGVVLWARRRWMRVKRKVAGWWK